VSSNYVADGSQILSNPLVTPHVQILSLRSDGFSALTERTPFTSAAATAVKNGQRRDLENRCHHRDKAKKNKNYSPTGRDNRQPL
jgi:hypothetical protein